MLKTIKVPILYYYFLLFCIGFEVLTCQKSCHLSSTEELASYDTKVVTKDYIMSNESEMLQDYRFKSNLKQIKNNNKTSSYLKKDELSFLTSLCQATNLTSTKQHLKIIIY